MLWIYSHYKYFNSVSVGIIFICQNALISKNQQFIGMAQKLFLFIYKRMHLYLNTTCMHLYSKLTTHNTVTYKLQVRIILICIEMYRNAD